MKTDWKFLAPGLKVCTEYWMPKIPIKITGLDEILGWDYGIEEPYWGPSSNSYQNEAFDRKWFFILMQINLIFPRKVVHFASSWKWGSLELGSGLFDCFEKPRTMRLFKTKNIILALISTSKPRLLFLGPSLSETVSLFTSLSSDAIEH